jgi:hypothetical protein
MDGVTAYFSTFIDRVRLVEWREFGEEFATEIGIEKAIESDVAERLIRREIMA